MLFRENTFSCIWQAHHTLGALNTISSNYPGRFVEVSSGASVTKYCKWTLLALWQRIKLLTWSRILILYGNQNVLLISTEWYTKYPRPSFSRNSFQQNNSHQLQKSHLYARNLTTVMQLYNYMQRRHFIMLCGTVYLLKSKHNSLQFNQKKEKYMKEASKVVAKRLKYAHKPHFCGLLLPSKWLCTIEF